MPCTGSPNGSFTVAVTRCCVPTGFVAVGGLSVSVVGTARITWLPPTAATCVVPWL